MELVNITFRNYIFPSVVYICKEKINYVPNAFFILTRKLDLRSFFISEMSKKKLQKDF